MKRFWLYFGVLVFLALLGAVGPSYLRWSMEQSQTQPASQSASVYSATQKAAIAAWQAPYNTGMAKLDAGHLDEAERNLVNAMAIARSIDPEGEQVALTHGLLADVYTFRSDHAKAEFELRAAMRLLVKVAGPDNELLASKGIKLAKNLINQNRPDEAELVLKEADRICKLPHTQNREIMQDIANVAWIMLLNPQGRSAEILEMCDAALDSIEKKMGPKSNRLMDALGVSVIAFDEAGRLARAEELQKRFVSLVEEKDGESSDFHADALRFLSGIQMHEGKFYEAEATIRRLIQIESARYGARGLIAAGLISDLTNLYIEAGWLDRALKNADEVIVRAPRSEFAYRARSYVLYEEGKFDEAWDDIQRARRIEADIDATVWYWVVANRRGAGQSVTSEVKTYVDQNSIKPDGPWPAPVLFFAAGRLSEDELLAKAQVSNRFKRRNNEAYADFVLGVKCLGEGDKTRAKAFFEQAEATHAECFEYRRALHELSILRGGAATAPTTASTTP